MTAILEHGQVRVRPPRVDGLEALRIAASFVGDPVRAMQTIYDRHGPIAEIFLPLRGGKRPTSFVFAAGAAYNERVLGDIRTFRTSGIIIKGPKDSAHERLRLGIVGMNGPQHVHYRRMLLPPLRRPMVDAMVARMGSIAQRNLAAWPAGETVDLWPLVQRLAQDIAISLLFTADDGDQREAHEVADLINAHVHMAGTLGVKACPVDIPGLPFHRLLMHAEKAEAGIVPWALKRRGTARRDDLLSIVVNTPDETGAAPSDSMVASQVLTLFGAAYETCQTVVAWTLFLLAQHPEAAAKLLDEVAAMPDGGMLLASQLAECKWLEGVVNESMRILPPVPVQMRVATRDVPDFGEHAIGERARVVLSSYLTNRMPGLFPEPAKFRPERWETLDPTQWEYMVFSAGVRFCPGMWFGTTLVKVAVSQIVKAFRIELVPGSRIDRHVSVTMAPKSGMPATLHRQDRKFARSAVTGTIPEMIAV